MKSSSASQFITSLISIGLLILLLVGLHIAAPFLLSYITGFFDQEMSRNTAQESFDTFIRLTKVFLWMSLVLVVVRFINSIIFTASFRARRGQQTSSLIRNVFSITIYIVAFFIVFKSQYPGIDLAAVFTTSAILGVILGLALQDTLGNLFAGISMQADQPFQVGDVINVPSKGTGVVESVTWRAVKIRTFQNKLVIINNSNLGKEAIEVAPRNNLNARIVYFSTLYTDSPTKTIHVVREAVRDAENVSTKIKPIVRIRNFGDSGLEWEVKYWLDDYGRYNETDALVRQRIWYAFLREHIHFAFPTRTLHIERPQPQPKVEEKYSEVFERLSEIEIFEPLTDEETLQLATAVQRRVFAPGEIIIRLGESGASMFVVNRGSVDIQIADAASGNGKMRVLATLHEGKFFGEMALFTGEPRTATVVALEETEVFEIGHAPIKNLLENNPYLVEAFSKAIAERRALLDATAGEKTKIVEEHSAGLFSAIKRFFSLG